MNININVAPDSKVLGQRAAAAIAGLLNQTIAQQGHARLLLSTGSSQFDTLESLLTYNIAWEKVEMFHLDEYVNLPESHAASFRRYLKERFVSKVNLRFAHFVSGEGDINANIQSLTEEVLKSPIDIGVIGIGENAHIAFNDPPADFETTAAYKIVTLDQRCRQQQVGEGWFAALEEVPEQAITMCVKQILSCKHIITAAPHSVKAEAIFNTITQPIDPQIPATILKTHPDWRLFIDAASAARLFSV
ncbi:glucosamine-6-phosphate deaminase [Clostridiales bacterium COT073_COT-073]|nr:glucosamine-6-phosphate deaminase [Clostridiales bacterium COT073_COT-073]